ncbi:MAG: DNA polymerase IV, partial [Candidatus Omnitrophica bacterium]|nr:DNA polymerase IV [Candidatus Omnitrophota bacterium]
KYAKVSREIFRIFKRFTPLVEPISIDEAFLDITGSFHLFCTLYETCLKIKSAIKKETSLTASIGLAPNKMTAKIASDIEKPNGLVIVNKSNLLSFLHPLPVNKLWGIGEKTHQALKQFGINTIGDLAGKNSAELINFFGKNGMHIWELANGIDNRDVETERVIKSISNEHTFDTDTSDMHKIKDVLMFLSEKVARRLRQSSFKGKTVTLKIRFSDFKTYTRAITLRESTNFEDVIYSKVIKKIEEFDLNKKTVRLLGVRLSNLSDSFSTEDLFNANSGVAQKKENLYKALDLILDKFGEGAINRRST